MVGFFLLRRLRKTPLFLIENMKKTTLSFYSVEISKRWLHCSLLSSIFSNFHRLYFLQIYCGRYQAYGHEHQTFVVLTFLSNPMRILVLMESQIFYVVGYNSHTNEDFIFDENPKADGYFLSMPRIWGAWILGPMLVLQGRAKRRVLL